MLRFFHSVTFLNISLPFPLKWYPIVWIYQVLSWRILCILVISTNFLFQVCGHKYSCTIFNRNFFFHFSWVYTWKLVEIWGQMLVVFLASCETSTLFSELVLTFLFPLEEYSVHSLPILVIIWLFNYQLSNRYGVFITLCFSCIFLMTTDFEHPFIGSVYQWRKHLETLDPLLDSVICSLLSLIVRVLTLCTLDARSLSAMRFANMFFHSLVCFHLSNMY